MRVGELDAAVLAVAEHADVVHRAGAIERDERDDVAERGRLHRGQRAPHAFGFQLEHADRVAALEQLVDRRIVPGQRGEIDADAALGEQALACFRTDKVFSPRKSNFTSPAASTYFMSNWVTGMSERGSR